MWRSKPGFWHHALSCNFSTSLRLLLHLYLNLFLFLSFSLYKNKPQSHTKKICYLLTLLVKSNIKFIWFLCVTTCCICLHCNYSAVTNKAVSSQGLVVLTVHSYWMPNWCYLSLTAVSAHKSLPCWRLPLWVLELWLSWWEWCEAMACWQ